MKEINNLLNGGIDSAYASHLAAGRQVSVPVFEIAPAKLVYNPSSVVHSK